MQAINTQFENYNLSHHNFIEAYKMINEYVAELYQLPKRLVEDAGEALDNFFYADSKPQTSFKMKKSCMVVIDFMDQLDEFTLNTIELFNQHKKHVDATRSYIRKVSALQTKYKALSVPMIKEEYIELIKDLDHLLKDLRLIKEKADNMISRLEKLELHWEDIKIKMN